METMVKLAVTDSEAERMFKSSVILEAEKCAHNRTSFKLDTAVMHLKKFLDEFEGRWDSDQQCDSVEIAMDYIIAAQWVKDNFGRTGDRISLVKEWIDLCPWEK